MAKEKILIVDDDTAINKLIASYLNKEQFTPFSAESGKQALSIIKQENPDLIILDVMLPDTDGPSLSLSIRKISNAPIIFLSCKTQEIDKIIALSAGGDDYMTKPFMPGELIARIKAHLRRQQSLSQDYQVQDANIFEADHLKVDFDTHECLVDDEEINLTSKEFDILSLFIKHPRKVFPAAQIFETVWKSSCLENDAKTVMVYISTLRKKLEKNNTPNYIISVRGVGYKFNQSLLK